MLLEAGLGGETDSGIGGMRKMMVLSRGHCRWDDWTV